MRNLHGGGLGMCRLVYWWCARAEKTNDKNACISLVIPGTNNLQLDLFGSTRCGDERSFPVFHRHLIDIRHETCFHLHP